MERFPLQLGVGVVLVFHDVYLVGPQFANLNTAPIDLSTMSSGAQQLTVNPLAQTQTQHTHNTTATVPQYNPHTGQVRLGIIV